MIGGIYLIHSDGRLVAMSKEGYNSEDLLQGLLAQYPNTAGVNGGRFALLAASMLVGSGILSAAILRWRP
jgi:hypothetical protein